VLFKLQFDIQFDVFVINVSGTNYFLFHLLEKQHFSKNKSMRRRGRNVYIIVKSGFGFEPFFHLTMKFILKNCSLLFKRNIENLTLFYSYGKETFQLFIKLFAFMASVSVLHVHFINI
jgi:hypothetical protein